MSVPLVRIDDPPPPAGPVAEAEPEADAEPWVPAVEPDVVAPAAAPVRSLAVQEPAGPAPDETRSGVPEPEHVGGYATPEPTPGDAARAAATRYCGMCGERVRVEADGLHCYLGHRLSPAHAERQRGGWLRRLFRRG